MSILIICHNAIFTFTAHIESSIHYNNSMNKGMGGAGGGQMGMKGG